MHSLETSDIRDMGQDWYDVESVATSSQDDSASGRNNAI